MRTSQHLFMTALVVLASTLPGPHQAHAQVLKVTAARWWTARRSEAS